MSKDADLWSLAETGRLMQRAALLFGDTNNIAVLAPQGASQGPSEATDVKDLDIAEHIELRSNQHNTLHSAV